MPLRRIAGSKVALLLLALSATSACRSKKSSSAPAAASASASAAGSASAPALRCRELSPEPGLSLGEKQPIVDGEDDGPELPFAPEVGQGVVLSSGFAASGLLTGKGGTEALVALLPRDGKPGRRLVLGPVHGGAGPPSLAARDQRLVAAVEDSDAAGATLRLMSFTSDAEKALAGAEITGVDREVGAAIAIGEKSAALVWGAVERRGQALSLTSFDPAKPQALAASRELTATNGAESPVLRARPGGFWLAWISELPPVDAGAPLADAGEDSLRLVDFGPRALGVVPLDQEGGMIGTPRIVGGGSEAPVVGFDAAVLGDGALVLAFRQGDSAPGVEGGAFELVRVELSGGVIRARAGDEELRPGVPRLLVEPGAPGRAWVSVRGADDATRLGLLDTPGTRVMSFAGGAELSGAELLAAAGGRMLVARARQRAIELSVLDCGF